MRNRNHRDPEELRLERNARRRDSYAAKRAIAAQNGNGNGNGNEDELLTAQIQNLLNQEYLDIGDLSTSFQNCNAMKFPQEKSRDFCCSHGKVMLPDYRELPEGIKEPLVNPHFCKIFVLTTKRFHLRRCGYMLNLR